MGGLGEALCAFAEEIFNSVYQIICAGAPVSLGRLQWDIGEHFGERRVGRARIRSLRRPRKYELKSLILAQIERWRHA